MAKKQLPKSAKVSGSKGKESTPPPAKIAAIRTWSLNTFVSDDNPQYTEFLSYIALGVSYAAASACVRLSISTLENWLAKYKEGSDNPLINRLGGDVLQNLGRASVVAEAERYARDKGGWLKSAVRSRLEDGNETLEQTNAVPTTNSLPPPSVTNNVLVIGDKLQTDALAALENAGIISVRRTNEVVDAPALPSK